MLIKHALLSAISKLKLCSNTPSLDSRILLCFTLKIRYEQLITIYNKPLPSDTESVFNSYIARRQNNEPVAYITRSKEFYGLDFLVTSDVLIPRPETELLVNKLIQINDKPYCKILELGVGSGAISVSLAKNLPASKITAIDLSNKAIEISKINAKKHNVENQINFIQSHWYQNLKDRNFDFIISNPPYINKTDVKLISESTMKYEPSIALYASNKGLEHYHTIIKDAKSYLKASGKILLEIGFGQAADVIDILKRNNFKDIHLIKDYSGIDRVIYGTTLNN